MSTEFCTVAPNIGISSLWYLSHVNFLEPIICRWLQEFWEMCASPEMRYFLWFGHSDRGFKRSSRHGCVFSPIFTLACVGVARGPDSSVGIATRGTF
jgi:hypothetical protein